MLLESGVSDEVGFLASLSTSVSSGDIFCLTE